VRSFFFVVFSYVSKAAAKISRKLEEEDEEKAVVAARDMSGSWGKAIRWKDSRQDLECSVTASKVFFRIATSSLRQWSSFE